MRMSKAIFLSAGVPDPNRGPEYAQTADVVAITSAVSALVYVTLGRRLLIWGGQPAITPMIWIMAQDININYGKWVTLYQSKYFKDEFPEDNERFKNVVFTEPVENDREKSLALMRERMFKETEFSAAVFIGGMSGVVREFELFQQFQPQAKVIPVVSTGGAAFDVSNIMGNVPDDLVQERDYVALFHRHLEVSMRENRYQLPDEQPENVEERFWRREAE